MISNRELWLSSKCTLCGSSSSQTVCQNCLINLQFQTRAFQRGNRCQGFAISEYKAEISDLIHQFKISGSTRLAQFMARAMVENLSANSKLLESLRCASKIAIVPIPSSTSATRKRGFVPTELLAKELATQLAHFLLIPTKSHKLLWFRKSVQDQSLLNVEQRARNLANSMQARVPYRLMSNSCILILLDDIVTSGATLLEGTRALTSAGKTPSIFLTFAETLQKVTRN